MIESLVYILAAGHLGHLGKVVFMIVLLICSAFFSGSETAFFNLPRRQVRHFSKSTVRLERLTALILDDSNRFLAALLFGNMTVNVLFFAMSSLLTLQVTQSSGPTYGTITGAVCFAAILLCGEMLPKSLAYSNSKRFCLVASPICYVLIRVLSPFLKVMDVIMIQPVVRLFVHSQKTTPVSVNQLRTLLDLSRRQGLISNDENQLMDEILKFSVLKARHVMQPRVEMPACSVEASVEELKQEMIRRKIDKIPVYTKSIDSIVGVVHLRDVLLNPDRPVASMMRTVHFVPEQKSVESLIEFFKKMQTDIAVVVDEYGGIAGWTEREDIIEHLLGTTEEIQNREPIEQIGPMKYRLMAGLSIHDWGQAFGIDIEQQRLTTLAGFVIALLGKIPKPDDSVTYKNMTFTVETVENNRIQTVILSLDPIADNKKETSNTDII